MATDDPEELRAAIQAFMDAHGLNVSAWCDRAAMSPNTLYSFMNRRSNDINYGTLRRLARAVGVTVATITGEAGLSERPGEGFEQMPDTLRRKLQADDIEIIKRLPTLDTGQKRMLSGMLKALPREPEKASSKKPRPHKEGRK